MTAFRILGALVAMALLVGATVRYRRRDIRLNLIISSRSG